MATDRRLRVTGISFLFFCLSLFLTAYTARNPRVGAIGTAALNEIQRPVQTVFVGGFGSVKTLWENYVALTHLRQDFEEQQEKLRSLEQDKARLLELEEENARLKKLLGAAQESSLPILEARVIAYDASNWVQAITVNRGSTDGVQTNMAVITAEGVVGQVIAVGMTSAKILLITDHSSGVDAQLEGSRVRGVVEGAGRKSLRWRFVLEEDEVKVGERVVTSGMDGVYPKGLFLGRVLDVERNEAGMFQRIEVAPAVNMARLEEVLIVKTVESVPRLPALAEKTEKKK